MQPDFREIAHSGGRLTITSTTLQDGRRAYQQKWENCRPNAAGLMAVWALPQGAVASICPLGGIGSSIPAPPVSGCLQVMIGSDSEGMYGHECHECKNYWRSLPFANFCPYCGVQRNPVDYLSSAQRRYVDLFCAEMRKFIGTAADQEFVVSWDEIADAAGRSGPKPQFFYSETSQQNNFVCSACGTRNDILGQFGFCSECGTRNDLQEIKTKILPKIREDIKNGAPAGDCVRDLVSMFDAMVGRYLKHLARFVPLSKARQGRIQRGRYHDVIQIKEDMKEIFDIDILHGVSAESLAFLKLMFLRRHVYEHNAGEVDEKYLSESGDASVKLKQLLRETPEDLYSLVGLMQTLVENLAEGFNEILPPLEAPINRKRRYSAAG